MITQQAIVTCNYPVFSNTKIHLIQAATIRSNWSISSSFTSHFHSPSDNFICANAVNPTSLYTFHCNQSQHIGATNLFLMYPIMGHQFVLSKSRSTLLARSRAVHPLSTRMKHMQQAHLAQVD